MIYKTGIELKNNTDKTSCALLIENKEVVKQLLLSMFIKKGIEIVCVSDTAGAKVILDNNKSDKFDLIITELDNNAIKCFELCEMIRTNYSKLELPFVGYSSNINAQVITSAFNIGFNDFFQLPFNAIEFNFRINTILETKKLADNNKKLLNMIGVRTQVFKMNTHDLKNPLSSVFSLSGIPVNSFNDEEEISQTMKVIHNASKIMLSLVNANLEFLNVTSESIELKKENVDLISLINQIVEINNPLAKAKHQQIIYDYPNTECIIVSDNNKLYQAINNIVSNAIKFSPLGKCIWINIIKDEPGKIKIKIRDEGPGFKKEEVDTVLIKFGKHSATPTGNEISTGLGLLITKQIVNLSDGKIYLESEEGKGATFTIEFPIKDNHKDII